MKRIHALHFIVFALAFSACEMVVDVDVPNPPSRLVANAFLQADSIVVVELTQSQSILTNAELKSVSGAVVTLLEETQLVATLEESETSGIYFSTFTPSVGKTYTLRVSKDGFESVEASTFIAPPVAIRSVELDTTVFLNTFLNFEDSLVTDRRVNIKEARLTLDDPGEERNYYEVSVYRNELQLLPRFDDEGNYSGDDTVRYLRQQTLRSEDPVVANTASDPLLGESGFYGTTLSFNDDLFNGKSYTLRFIPEVYGFSFEGSEGRLYVILSTVSEGQYRYTRSVDLQYENDGNPFAEPVQVYTNVENGFGIMAGSSASQVIVSLE
ncbi:MAG: DUF4249 domain-containing protein [Tunicatimonas sp.]